MAKSGSEFVRTLRNKAKDGTLKNLWADWKWIWGFSRRRWGSVVLYTLFGILSSTLGLVAGVVGKYMIDAIIAMDLSRLGMYCVLTIISAVLGVAFQSLTSRFSAKLSIDMLGDVQGKVFSEVMHSDWSALSKYPTGELLNRFSGDIGTVASCAVSWLPGVIIQSFTVLATLGVILYYDPVMALIGCASTPLMFLASRSLLRKQRHHNQRMRQVSGDMSAFQSETFRNMDTLKSFGVEEQMERKLQQRQDDYRDTVLRYNRFTIRTNIWLTAMGTAVQYGAMAYCLWRLWRGDILFGTMTLFLQQRASLSSAFSSLVSLVPTALSGSVAAERIRELTELPKEPHYETPTVHGSCTLEAKQIRVGYNTQRTVLEDVDITAPAGQIIALVGPSGEGKTTLLRMLLGLIRPDQGSIQLIDETGSRYPVGADTRNCFTYVPQGNTMIAGTVAENLLLARENATEQELIEALNDACAWEFVKELPLGIHTPIGENGKGLSEGQAQRLAIARALTRRAPVMLLDEVTSALDRDTEQRVLENLCRRGVTTIVTTHRPSVLRMCSQIYQVHNGQVHPITHEQCDQQL
ncbi:MAG: ABC transporter ATP-binding protein [Oscillospiraceae bacterium]|nr:ABC transporter ATP-binding protein [Oscillospiraceae bacterium]